MSRTGKKLEFDSNYTEQLTLADGRTVTLRPIRPADKQLLVQGLARMSSESRYLRFMGARSRLTQAQLRYLSEVDGFNHFAIGAVAINGDGSEEGVAAARFVRLKNEPTVAEPAVAIIDDYQGQGLGRAMLDRLVSAARERGVERFRCDFLSHNHRIRHLLVELGVTVSTWARNGVVTMEFELPRPTGRERRPETSRRRKPAGRLGRLPSVRALAVVERSVRGRNQRHGAARTGTTETDHEAKMEQRKPGIAA